MSESGLAAADRLPWHRLLAPLPSSARINRKSVASSEASESAVGAPIAGWQQLVVELSAGSAGLRIVLVVIDETGAPLAASDHVLYCSAGQPMLMLQESIGGRFESDGTFRGTCWRTEGPVPQPGKEPAWQSTPREPTDAEVAALLALVADVRERQPSPELD